MANDLGAPASLTVTLLNMETQEPVSLQGNPNDLKIALSADYTEFDVIGSSFKPMQYVGTSNIELSFTLQIIPETLDEFETAHDLEYFLYGLLYPSEPGGSPPDVLIMWPEYLTLHVKFTSLSVQWSAYNDLGTPTIGTIACTVKNVRATRLLGGDIRRRGLRLP